MNYDIHITLSAERDLGRVADYIEFTLKNPQAAVRLLDETERQINALSQFLRNFLGARSDLSGQG